jgi:hypothetical protein
MGARLIRIAISQAAFDAIVATMPLGSVGYENASNENGQAGFLGLWLCLPQPHAPPVAVLLCQARSAA